MSEWRETNFGKVPIDWDILHLKISVNCLQMVHAYDEELANEIAGAIVKDYHPLFIQLQTRLQIEYLA
jgi:hypothetical protein